MRHVAAKDYTGSESLLYALTAGVAIAAWLLPWLLMGEREAWDQGSYFVISLPLMSAATGYAGYQAQTRPWRWPLTLIVAQFATALLLGGFGNLMPVGIIAFAVLAAPAAVTAWIGARLGRRKEQFILRTRQRTE